MSYSSLELKDPSKTRQKDFFKSKTYIELWDFRTWQINYFKFFPKGKIFQNRKNDFTTRYVSQTNIRQTGCQKQQNNILKFLTGIVFQATSLKFSHQSTAKREKKNISKDLSFYAFLS